MNIADDKHLEECPLKAVHRRLEDLHSHWHQAEGAYFEPDKFRIAIQTAIQTSRTVTFILQANKRHIPGFDDWYEEWRKKLADIPLMRWMVDARNRIEKQGDLEANSYIRAEIIASYLNEGPVIDVPAQLSDAPIKLLKSIPNSQLGEHIRRDGYLRIQRRWVENSLPDFELLEAVAIAYGHLSKLLDDAHRQIGIEIPRTVHVATGEAYDREMLNGRLPCMIGHEDHRTLSIWLANGRPVDLKLVEKTLDVARAEETIKRYDLKPEDIFGKSRNPVEMQNHLFATAKKMFLRDGHHVTILFLFQEGVLRQTLLLEPEEHGEKYIMLRTIAHEIPKKGIDAAILIGEVWSAPYDPMKPYQRAADSSDKREALAVTLVSRDGEPRKLSAEIDRSRKDDIQLKETVEQLGGAHFMFAPFYEAWGRTIPEDWANNTQDGR